MKRWITGAILIAAAFVPMLAHADSTQPASATRPSEDSTLNPFLNGQEERDMQNQFDQARRGMVHIQITPHPTTIPSAAIFTNDPWSWGLLMTTPPTTRPWREFQFNGATVYILPLNSYAEKK